MSHHSRKHKSSSGLTNDECENLIEQSKSIVNLLNEIVATRPHEWQTYVVSARSAMTALDRVRFFRSTSRFAEQVWLLEGLQNFAFHDSDSGCIVEIAEWCKAAWLLLLRTYPENVDVLTGMLLQLLNGD